MIDFEKKIDQMATITSKEDVTNVSRAIVDVGALPKNFRKNKCQTHQRSMA